MVLAVMEKNKLKMFLDSYEKDAHVQKMKEYKQHGIVSTYEHCKNVARVSLWINQKFKLSVDEKALATGAFLHDFYLYDWHIPGTHQRFHGFSHADIACQNAVKYFNIGLKEQSIIRSHMWPLNITCIPRNREAVIVCIADKFCSVIETLCQRKRNFDICG